MCPIKFYINHYITVLDRVFNVYLEKRQTKIKYFAKLQMLVWEF